MRALSFLYPAPEGGENVVNEATDFTYGELYWIIKVASTLRTTQISMCHLQKIIYIFNR